MIKPGTVITYLEMCQEESGHPLQRGMNFHLGGSYSVILMSVRPGAPYADKIEKEGKIIIYEGHDELGKKDGAPSKKLDQPLSTTTGKLTQNGLFLQTVLGYKSGKANPELVRVYEKITRGVWVYNGAFKLLDGWPEISQQRIVYKFKLEVTDEAVDNVVSDELDHNRIIPTAIKVEVWKRDHGRCVICGEKDNLHFDHIIPFSKGGSSLVASNIQLLCARHNLNKHNKIL